MSVTSRINRLNPRIKQQQSEETKDKFEDLLVFGYACKLFRDDEKATEIDQGKFLIPWMGDKSIMIDRYDARGTLYDLKLFEAPITNHDRFHGLSAEERQLEERLDEERYFALYKDEVEEAVIREEELKRINQDLCDATSGEVSYRQVPFSYSNTEKGETETNYTDVPIKSIIGELGDSIYVPPSSLDVPPEMVVPPTQKLARIIEKTANFISSHGVQMEIIVKAKQANNPMFQFLHFDSQFHPFYRHILTSIRNGTYTVSAEDENEAVPKESTTNEESVQSRKQLDLSNEVSVQEEQGAVSEVGPSAESPIHEPSIEVKILIDKTASFMSKHSRDLENIVATKGGDPRFTFLNPQHPFHSYYVEKYTLYKSLLEAQQLAIKATQESSKSLASTANRVSTTQDAELKQSERRKKAALFLNQMKKNVAIGDDSNGAIESKFTEVDSPRSITKEPSRSPDDIEIIGSIRKERTHSRSVSRSRSVQREQRRNRRSRSRSYDRYRTRSRSQTRGRSSSRSRHRSPSASRLSRRSPSPDRYRHRHRKKHRSRERRKKEKKRRSSRERRERKKRRRRSRSRSSSLSASPNPGRSPVRSRSSTPSSKKSADRSPCQVVRLLPRKMAENTMSGSETSSPLPSNLIATQPAFAKLAEGIRAKVIAMIEGDKK